MLEVCQLICQLESRVVYLNKADNYQTDWSKKQVCKEEANVQGHMLGN